MGFSVCCRFGAGKTKKTGGDRETRRKMSSRFAWRVDYLFRVWEDFSFFSLLMMIVGFQEGQCVTLQRTASSIFHAKDASYREYGDERYQRQQEA